MHEPAGTSAATTPSPTLATLTTGSTGKQAPVYIPSHSPHTFTRSTGKPQYIYLLIFYVRGRKLAKSNKNNENKKPTDLLLLLSSKGESQYAFSFSYIY